MVPPSPNPSEIDLKLRHATAEKLLQQATENEAPPNVLGALCNWIQDLELQILKVRTNPRDRGRRDRYS